MEEWKTIIIDNEEVNYEVSSFGRVRNKKRKNILSVHKVSGYYKVHLSINGKKKMCSIHRLVAIAFIPNPNNLPQINHKDEDSSNNYVQNLEWCTASYNINYGTRNQRMVEALNNYDREWLRRPMTKEQKEKRTGSLNGRATKIICFNNYKVYDYIKQASEELNCGINYITNVCKNRQKFVRNRETKEALYFMYYDEFMQICNKNN